LGRGVDLNRPSTATQAIQGGSGEPPLPDPRKARPPCEIVLYGTSNLEGQHKLRAGQHTDRALFATRREELKFRLLRKTDLSPVNYKRVAEKDGKEVPWDQIVKGYAV